MYSIIQKSIKNIAAAILIQLCFLGYVHAQGNNFVELRGRIVDQEKNQPIAGVSVQIKGAKIGTVTNTEGNFSIRTKANYPFVLVISSVGFQAQEYTITGPNTALTIGLQTQTIIANEVVVRANRISEKELKSPISIQKLDIRAIRESPAASFFDAMENTKGVQLTTTSLTFKMPNSRGFNIPNNYRFVQLTDGVDMQAATLGVSLGNAIGPTELDISSMEITPGASAGVYGMNAVNGMAQFITKNPFEYQGLSVYQKGGINHLGENALGGLTETALRWAKAMNDQWAYKVNFSYLRGNDWISDSRWNQNPNDKLAANPSFSALKEGVVAFDGWNKYGDDVVAGSNTVSVSGLNINGKNNQTLTVARTGYWEKDLIHPVVNNLKFDAGIYYKIKPQLMLQYTYRMGRMDGVFQRGNKVQLDNVSVQNHKVELSGKQFWARAYVSLENTGNSYNVKPLADNLDLYSGGSNAVWAQKYKTALQNFAQNNGGVLNDGNLAAANDYARQQADAGRVLPGTEAFNQLKNTIIGINNWDIQSAQTPNAPLTGGAALVQKSNTYHLESQWNLKDKVKFAEILLGADARLYQIIPDGNNFVDLNRPISERNLALPNGTFGKAIYYGKIGMFAQANKSFFEEKLKIVASLRLDYNPDFSAKFTPRWAAVFTPVKNHFFRGAFQTGYRFPSIFEALSYVNNGNVRRVGILDRINEGLGYLENSYTQASVVAFNNVVKQQGNTDAAALANRNLLQAANLPKGEPEKITVFELGYKSVVLDHKLVIDWDAYLNNYQGFLGQVQVFVPHGATVGSDEAVIAMLDRNRNAQAATATTAASQGQDRYRVYTNANNHYLNFGSALALSYQVYQKFVLSGNVSFNKLKKITQNDLFITGFNTPEWSTNVSVSNRQLIKNVGFTVLYRWQQAFLWESPLVTGMVPAFSNVDAQISYQIPKYKTTLKLGGTNIFNKRYIQYAGGPKLGALVYAAVTIEGLSIR